ncbi:MAG: ABC transporter ATP-binding protein [Verrucomicrobia bacterium]|nr:ABC transporter ATP-binding protein [Verrucomicrobiota bacterium]
MGHRFCSPPSLYNGARRPYPTRVLDVRALSISFCSRAGEVTAVDGVSFQIQPGQTVAMVGESGSGKSVTALALTRLLPQPPAVYRSGDILLNGESVLNMGAGRLRQTRGGAIAYVFQEPATSLNPVLTIGRQLAENIRLHRPDVSDVRTEAIYWLEQVGIAEPAKRITAYPFQLSGGMQQRVMIAMALSGRPQLLVADEPTTALDVTVQKQILDLFRELKAKFTMSILLITHNFGIVHGLADQVAVMWQGRLVEQGPAERVLEHPEHPYTRALIDCVPRLGARLPRLKTIEIEIRTAPPRPA